MHAVDSSSLMAEVRLLVQQVRSDCARRVQESNARLVRSRELVARPLGKGTVLSVADSPSPTAVRTPGILAELGP